ncbi:hypothetical protein PAMA_019679 [Pampus argenteus]
MCCWEPWGSVKQGGGGEEVSTPDSQSGRQAGLCTVSVHGAKDWAKQGPGSGGTTWPVTAMKNRCVRPYPSNGQARKSARRAPVVPMLRHWVQQGDLACQLGQLLNSGMLTGKGNSDFTDTTKMD